jgi:cytoskeletal protein RodZ
MSKVERGAMAGLFVVAALASIAVVQSSGEQAAITGDFRSAAAAEVHDSQGNVLARGTFAPVEAEDAGEVERIAPLTNASGQAAGEVEIEYAQDRPTEQEIELTLSGATPGGDVTLLVDGQRVLTGKAGNDGRVEVEVMVRSGM